jgi:hypothetical protein
MSKKARIAKKPGKDEAIGAEELLERYTPLKQFFEHNWGRIGLQLQRLHNPDDIRATLKLVPGVEWCIPFREEAPLGCLLKDGAAEVGWRDVALTRQQLKDAEAIEHNLSLEYHPTRQNAEEAATALKVLISQLKTAIQFFPFFAVIFIAAEKLGLRELAASSSRLEAEFRQAQKGRQNLKEKLLSQSAWYARNEIVRFAKSRRYVATPITFAKAMAGLPEYGWIHSFRKCGQIKEKPGAHIEYAYQLFQLLMELSRKMKPLYLAKLEMKLRNKLLDKDANWLLRSYVSPHWAYMKQAFAECRGKGFERSELPYKIMGRFLAHLERPKAAIEVELAKREQLVQEFS